VLKDQPREPQQKEEYDKLDYLEEEEGEMKEKEYSYGFN
jgi:hypothetical protein